ncbi:helix-turn-helix transcriptional regulator [Actinomycetospora flava]|uniref:Helix-turn-helix transcriptional regulator n=1 Tax=Actinomycetospora flava TaxID=3129232 RepID=A0ABU8M9A0_9PSEU
MTATPSARFPPGVRREVWSTTRPDEAHELMRTAYTDHTPRLSGDLTDFVFARSTTTAGSFSVDRMGFSAEFSGRSAPSTGLLIINQPLNHMPLSISCERRTVSTPVMLTPTWSPFTAEWEGLDLRLTTLDAAGVARLGAGMSGLPADGVVFAGVAPVAPELGRYWAALTAYVNDNVLAEGFDPPPLLLAETFRQLATAALLVFPNSTHREQLRSPDDGEPAAVRRATEFMDTHAGEDIGITEIAEAARLGPRGLQAAFRKHRDQTPLAYLRRVRMDGAHRDLQAADPTLGDTVGAIAAQWGFANPGRFAVDYRRTYGRSPSDTLRR